MEIVAVEAVEGEDGSWDIQSRKPDDAEKIWAREMGKRKPKATNSKTGTMIRYNR